MLPFVRTAREVAGLPRARRREPGCSTGPGFELWVMAEVPSVLFQLARYAELGIAGISIGSNDLTQLLLGVDRDSELLAEVFDERDPAVVEYIAAADRRARASSACRPRSAARRRPCIRSTPSCSCAPASTRSR